MSVDPALVARHVAALDAGARAALLADCLAARGETVARDGRVVRVDDGDRTVAVAGGSWPADAPDPDLTFDVDDLRDLLLYGLDRPAADRVATAHLGAPLADLRPPRRGRALARRVAPSLVVLVVLVAAAAAVAGPLAGAPGAVTPTPAAPDGETGPERTPDAGTPAGETPDGPPPGVGAAGVTDPDALAAAHDRERPPSYRVAVTTERTAPNTEIRRNVTMRVAGDRYLATATLRVGGDRVDAETVYGDDRGRWAATTAGDVRTVRRLDAGETGLPSVDPAATGGERVAAALRTQETNVSGLERTADGRAVYRVVGRGPPPTSEAETYRVVALVSPDGFVVSLTVEYTLGGLQDGARRFAWRYGWGPEAVERPAWVPTG